MILDPDDCERFFGLHKAPTLFVRRVASPRRCLGRCDSVR